MSQLHPVRITPSNFLKNDYHRNIWLTSQNTVRCHNATIPHPNLHEFFLDCLTLEDMDAILSRNVGNYQFTLHNIPKGRSQCPCGLRRRSSAARRLGLLFRISPGEQLSVCSEWYELSGRRNCDELITRPEESYRVRCIVMWSRNLVNEEVAPNTNKQTFRKSEDVICTAAAACNHARYAHNTHIST
jgi:hypothetical protein